MLLALDIFINTCSGSSIAEAKIEITTNGLSPVTLIECTLAILISRFYLNMKKKGWPPKGMKESLPAALYLETLRNPVSYPAPKGRRKELMGHCEPLRERNNLLFYIIIAWDRELYCCQVLK